MSIIKQMDIILERTNRFLDYELQWLDFLNYLIRKKKVICVKDTDMYISNYTLEFQCYIKIKAKEYIKANFSSWERLQVSATYSKFSNTRREKMNDEVQTLVGQFFTWKKKDDDEIRKQTNELIVNTEIKILKEQEELESIQARIKALRR